MREALRRFLAQSERVTRAHGLTPQRYQLLLMIRTARDGSGGASLGELRQRLHLPQSTLTELLHRAEDLGLLERALIPSDRRRVYFRLTDEGERRLAGAVAELSPDRRRLISLLSELGT